MERLPTSYLAYLARVEIPSGPESNAWGSSRSGSETVSIYEVIDLPKITAASMAVITGGSSRERLLGLFFSYSPDNLLPYMHVDDVCAWRKVRVGGWVASGGGSLVWSGR